MFILYDAVASGFIARETVQWDDPILSNQAFGTLFNFRTARQSLIIGRSRHYHLWSLIQLNSRAQLNFQLRTPLFFHRFGCGLFTRMMSGTRDVGNRVECVSEDEFSSLFGMV